MVREEFWRFTELHYSQTSRNAELFRSMFWRFTELHYSQTTAVRDRLNNIVLEIYRITLLSNGPYGHGATA